MNQNHIAWCNMFSNYMNLQNMFTQLNISLNLSATLDMEKDGGLKFLHQVYGDYTERSIFTVTD